jgi:polyisoprenyl-phosphate glycosyltransferase
MAITYQPRMPRSRPRLVSLVIPIYNEVAALPLLFDRLEGLLEMLGTEGEIVLVNDGSSDRSLDLLLERAAQDGRFKVISLARNFGHQIASTAGLDRAQGDAVILMDADLQDPPELVLDMISKYEEGYDVVYARRVQRDGETPLKRATAWLFYRIMRALVHPDLPVDVGDFRLMARPCLQALQSMREMHRFLRGMVTWVGFSQTSVDFIRPARVAGVTKYPMRKMLLFAWNAALSFSALPLRLAFGIGIFLVGVAMAYAAYALWRYYTGGFVVPGWTSLIVVNCLTSGAVMIWIGILGEYVSRIFEEIKTRPLYTVSITANLDNEVTPRNVHPGEIATVYRKL